MPMDISVKFDAFDIFPEFHFEPVADLRAKALLQETETWLKSRIYELTREIINTPIGTGSEAERNRDIATTNLMKGKIDAFTEMLMNSRDAKIMMAQQAAE